MTESARTNVTPCRNCRYLTEPVVAHSEELGEIKATLAPDGSIVVHRPSDCGTGHFQKLEGGAIKLESGVIENQSKTAAKDIKQCTGSFTETVPVPRKWLGWLGIKEEVEVVHCGSLYDGDIIQIVERELLHPARIEEQGV
jgi:hypothetical protein